MNVTSLTKGQTIGWRRSLINFVEYPRPDTLDNLLDIVFNDQFRGISIPNIEQQVELIHVIISHITRSLFIETLTKLMTSREDHAWVTNRILPLLLIVTRSIPDELMI